MKRLLVILALLLAACGQAETTTPTEQPTAAPTEAPTEQPTAAPTEAPAVEAFPLTVTDGLDRSVTIEAVPERIVSLAPSNTEILFAIGAGDQVVGVTSFCNYPPEAQTREQVGGFSAQTISVESIVALEPDLVLAAGELQAPVIEALEQVGIPVVAIEAGSFDDVYATIEQVGQLTGHADQAAEVISAMQERVAAVQEVAATIPEAERVSVYWEVYNEPLITVGPNTFIGQMIDLAGATSIFSDVEEDYPQISAEEVVSRDPQVILGPDSQAGVLTVESLAQRPGWESIAAIVNGRVYAINGDIVSRPGPRLADALEAIAAAVYPERFAQ